MTDEDEEFNRIERESRIKQDYVRDIKKPSREALMAEVAVLTELVRVLSDKVAELEAKQEQGEPVYLIWFEGSQKGGWINVEKRKYDKTDEEDRWLLYTTPQQRTWVGLTDEERHKVMQDRTWMHTEGLCQAIEAKLKEKNT